jgi:tol-pal system protein YbgF
MRWQFLLGTVVAAATVAGCVGTKDIEAIQTQNRDIQRQVALAQQVASSKDEVARLEARMSEQTSALLKSEADMQIGLQRLSEQIERLEANLAETSFRLNDLSQQIAATNQELRAVRNSVGSAAAPGQPGAATSSPPAVPDDPQALYEAARNDYVRGNYELAILGFRRYLEAFPDSELADNARYWMGECNFSQGNYQQAIREFDGILRDYPRSDKLASALLKKGYAFLQMGRLSEGRAQLRSVINTYSGSDEAVLAQQRLDALAGSS